MSNANRKGLTHHRRHRQDNLIGRNGRTVVKVAVAHHRIRILLPPPPHNDKRHDPNLLLILLLYMYGLHHIDVFLPTTPHFLLPLYARPFRWTAPTRDKFVPRRSAADRIPPTNSSDSLYKPLQRYGHTPLYAASTLEYFSHPCSRDIPSLSITRIGTVRLSMPYSCRPAHWRYTSLSPTPTLVWRHAVQPRHLPSAAILAKYVHQLATITKRHENGDWYISPSRLRFDRLQIPSVGDSSTQSTHVHTISLLLYE